MKVDQMEGKFNLIYYSCNEWVYVSIDTYSIEEVEEVFPKSFVSTLNIFYIISSASLIHVQIRCSIYTENRGTQLFISMIT